MKTNTILAIIALATLASCGKQPEPPVAAKPKPAAPNPAPTPAPTPAPAK